MGEHGKRRFGGKDGRMVICIVDHSDQTLAPCGGFGAVRYRCS